MLSYLPFRGGFIHCDFDGHERQRIDRDEVHRTLLTANGGIVACYVEVDGVVVSTFASVDLVVDPATMIVSCDGDLVGWFTPADAA